MIISRNMYGYNILMIKMKITSRNIYGYNIYGYIIY
jgi:hypothetical protein